VVEMRLEATAHSPGRTKSGRNSFRFLPDASRGGVGDTARGLPRRDRPVEVPSGAEGRHLVAVAGPSPDPTPIHQSFVVPYFSDHAFVFSGALKARGHSCRVLPLPSEKIRLLGETHTSGKECHPYSLLTGDLVHLARLVRCRIGAGASRTVTWDQLKLPRLLPMEKDISTDNVVP